MTTLPATPHGTGPSLTRDRRAAVPASAVRAAAWGTAVAAASFVSTVALGPVSIAPVLGSLGAVVGGLGIGVVGTSLLRRRDVRPLWRVGWADDEESSV